MEKQTAFDSAASAIGASPVDSLEDTGDAELSEASLLRAATVTTAEAVADSSLRPHTLASFIGQDALKSNLATYIAAARERGEALDHLFLIGPPGLGKTTLAQITARELGVDFKVTSAPALEKAKDLAGILSTITDRTVFFIDEIHRLKTAIAEMLYIAMEDYELDWIVGTGAAARTLRIPIPRFTLVGATTKAGIVPAPLIARFGIVERFDFYDHSALAAIIHRSAAILGVTVTTAAAVALAAAARGTPRVANRLLRRMRDFAQTASRHSGENRESASAVREITGAEDGSVPPFSGGEGVTITETLVAEGLRRLEIDRLGLESHDRHILRSVIENFSGGPVGADTLAISINEDTDTLEDYYEPFLIQCGLLQRTGRGRIATEKAYAHLGLPRKGKDETDRLLF